MAEHLEAAVYFTKAIELDPVQPYYFLHRGEAYEHLGFVELAVNDYQKFKTLNPKFKDELEYLIQGAKSTGDDERQKSLSKYLQKIASL